MGGPRNEYHHVSGIYVRRGGRSRSGLGHNEYEDLIARTCISWSQDGINWLKNRFGNDYRGHLGLLGTALVACYAALKCHYYVLEPVIIAQGLGIDLSGINPDIALVINDKLLILEVKVHHKGMEEGGLISQIDGFVENYGNLLWKFRVYLGVIHMIMHGKQLNIERRPHWLTIMNLTPGKNIYDELDEIITDLMK
ncbi:hypothetical protein [Caldivirga sp.]|uniref:hypothetical protein n=1 Tax=Caldivirga sp. TaxID=2080243 RepID=UPI0025C6A885|nr:hypothetical protein [Caldivirga sp.]